MKSRIHHTALNVTAFDWYVDFFQKVFGMTVERAVGKAPERKIWFCEGIQLIESKSASDCGSVYDHLSLAVDDIPGAVGMAVNFGCSTLPKGAHWFKLPNGVEVELKPLLVP